MSNRNIPDYGINWGTQLVTVDEMNIFTNQVINDSAYLTDPLVPLIYSGGQITLASSTSISITAGTFRLPDIATSWPSPYNVAIANFKCPSVTLSGLTTNGTFYIVARISANTTDPNLIIYTGSYLSVSSVVSSTDVVLGYFVVAANVISNINYDGIRANDLTTILTPTKTSFLSSTGTVPSGFNNFVYVLSATVNTGLPDITSIIGGLYARTKYNFINNTIYPVTIVPNTNPASSTILGISSFVLPQYSTASFSYDQYANTWYLN